MPKPVFIKFEQAFLVEAFRYSLADDVANTDKVVRALRGLLVQPKVKRKFEKKGYTEKLDGFERRPVPGINKDIYTVTGWIRDGVDEVLLYQDGVPVKTVKTGLVKKRLRFILDELNAMTGDLCEVLQISPLQTGEQKTGWPKAGGETG